MTRTMSRGIRMVLILIFILAMVGYIKSTDKVEEHIFLPIAMLSKIIELFVWMYEPDK